MIEDWESDEDLAADAASDHVVAFFSEMGTLWGDVELGTDKAIKMTVKTMKGVHFKEWYVNVDSPFVWPWSWAIYI